jgi:hypothetical protein
VEKEEEVEEEEEEEGSCGSTRGWEPATFGRRRMGRIGTWDRTFRLALNLVLATRIHKFPKNFSKIVQKFPKIIL